MSNHTCNKCNNKCSLKIMSVIDGKCWKCEAQMKVAVLHSTSGYIRGETNPGPDQFTEEEIKFAESKGVLIKKHHSQTADDTYLANTCRECNVFVGSHYLFTEYFSPAKYNKLKSSDFEIGYHCEDCYLEEEMTIYNEQHGET